MIMVTGALGQLGSEVALELERRGKPFLAVDIDELDIVNRAGVSEFLRLHKPDTLIHCAAYTDVEGAEDNAELCMCVNGEGTENLAAACREIDAEMIYISTDYVFGGDGDIPHEVDSRKNPLSVYGQSKLAGEDAVLRHLDRHYIVRISWVFGKNGNNFVKTMLRLGGERDELNVVADQIGSPTYAADLAVLLCDMAQSGKYGIYHATNEGFCSWAEFAQEIMRVGGKSCEVNPIPSDAYPSKAARPKNSRLSKASLDAAGFDRLPNWQDAVMRFVIGDCCR